MGDGTHRTAEFFRGLEVPPLHGGEHGTPFFLVPAFSTHYAHQRGSLGDAVCQGHTQGTPWERLELRKRLLLSSKWFLCVCEQNLGAVKILLIYTNWGKKW